MRMRSKKGELAVVPPTFTKVETKLNGGFATIAQRTDCQIVDLVMDYSHDGVLYQAGMAKVILAGDAGLKPWAKKVIVANGVQFALCPEGEVIGFITPGASTQPSVGTYQPPTVGEGHVVSKPNGGTLT